MPRPIQSLTKWVYNSQPLVQPPSTPSPYQYQPLPERRSIRLLTLHPARKPTSPIQCSFTQITLADDDATEVYYEALSYTWGASHGTKPIVCDAGSILVTPNCEQALLHLRYKLKPRMLWIDAICIEQCSSSERNHQVAIMGEIYSHAARTILWLGPETERELVQTLRNAARYGGWINGAKRGYRRVHRKKEPQSVMDRWHVKVLSSVESERVAALCSNEWFLRMWTIQELWLSKSAIFMMGKTTCPYNALYSYYCIGRNLVARPDLEHFRVRISFAAMGPLGGSLVESVDRAYLVSIIQLAAINKATDARDKVYGMIAYLSKNCPQVKLPAVDYTMSIADIFESFTRALIAATGKLWPLELVGGTCKPGAPLLPSWVLDLRNQDCLTPEWGDWLGSHTHFKSTSFKPIVAVDEPGQLSVLAQRIGKITQLSSRMPVWDSKTKARPAAELDQARAACLAEWTAFAAALDLQNDPETTPYLQRGAAHKGIWRDYCDDDGIPCLNPHFRALQYFTNQLDYLRHRTQLEDDVSMDSYPFYESEADAAKRRRRKWVKRRKEAEEESSYFDGHRWAHDQCRLFFLSTGHLGVSPGDVRVGDPVCVVQGSIVPFVLRRQRGSGRRAFSVVGKADVHLMTEVEEWTPKVLEQDGKGRVVVLV